VKVWTEGTKKKEMERGRMQIAVKGHTYISSSMMVRSIE